jgi:alpha-mannosidase
MKIIVRFLLLGFLGSQFWVGFAQHASKHDQVFVVPFSHLDLFWGGTQEECLSRGNRIISRAMQLAEEHPEFRFLIEDEVFAANFMESRRGTAEAEHLRKLVRAGRIEVAPKWAAIYQNLPREEALVRNLAYGKRYAREVFGVDPLVAPLTDLPGFTQQYPQVLAKSGIPYMVMTRMGPPNTPLFRWKAPDGSSVLVWDTTKGYSWGVNLGLHRELDDTHLKRIGDEVGEVQSLTRAPVYLPWALDLFAPNDALVKNLAVLNQRLAPATFRFATPTEYFRAAEKIPSVPEISGEITGSWANLNSSASATWPPAVEAADVLVTAEKFATINDALGYEPYPRVKLDELWKDAIESMDHNFFGQGGAIGDARKVGFANTAILEGGQILRKSLRNIAEQVRRPAGKGPAIVVFNPLGWTRDDVVRAHVTLYGDVAPADIQDFRKGMKLVDDKGNSVPFDVEAHSENISRAVTILFVARQVPSLGYRTYSLEPGASPSQTGTASSLSLDEDNRNPFRVSGSDVIENQFFRVAVDHATGGIEIRDKKLDRIVAKDVEISGVETRGGDAITIFPTTGRTIARVVDSVKLIRNGAEETVLDISGSVAGEPVMQRLTLYRNLPRIDVENTIRWRPGRFMEIQQVFPLDLQDAEVRSGVPFGSVTEAEMMPGAGPSQGDEVKPEVWKHWRQVQHWISSSRRDGCVTISSDHQLFTVDDHAIRGDMLRGTSFNQLRTFEDGKPAPVQQPTAGTYVYRYSIRSDAGNWVGAKAWQHGMEFNMPLIGVVSEDELSTKTLPLSQSFLSVTGGGSLVVTALKKAEKDKGFVVRLFEAAGESPNTTIEFLGRKRSFKLVNMMEEPSAGGNEQILAVRPYEIYTIVIPAAEVGPK